MADWKNRIIGTGEEDPQKLAANPRNWRVHPQHQKEVVDGLLDEIGWVQTVMVNKQTGLIVDGHLRVKLAIENGESSVHVSYVDLTPEEELQVLAMLDPSSALAGADLDILREIAEEITFDNPVVQAEFDELLANAGITVDDDGLHDVGDEDNVYKDSPRELPLDVIYTISGGNATCCIAVNSGLQYGVQSGSKVCPKADYAPGHFVINELAPGGDQGELDTCCVATQAGFRYGLKSGKRPCPNHTENKHRVVFIDNDYFDYDHEIHRAFVEKYRPKYATVKDVMTRAQCKAAGIEYTPLEQILEWAKDLEQFAENVIVIPKYDCLAQIPERYVLGYSIPTSHGGTPLAPERFRGRRIHLLGGSWKKQLQFLDFFGMM